jgi:UDP-2,3-diacylglucosamine pyrophosphatase LpxH
VRTLVVSDLHLGARLRRDVLRRPAALEALLAALDGIDRLVLLGDVVELQEGRDRRAMDVAEPVLRAIGARLGSGREVILVPGNHDGVLIGPWLRAQRGPPAVDASVGLDATPVLTQVASWLAPARVEVRYPGVWLAEGVWATHGHYLDRHLLPVSAFGVARGLSRRLPSDSAAAVDYERSSGASPMRRARTLLVRWLPRPLAALVDDVAEFLRAATMPRIARRISSRRLAPVIAMVLNVQVRRAAIPALARVVQRLGVDADWVIFGHVHRCGPLPADDPERWRAPGGTPRIVNTGSWVYEPLLVHRAIAPHPYWPGGAVLLEDGREPRAIGLLDHLDAKALQARQIGP